MKVVVLVNRDDDDPELKARLEVETLAVGLPMLTASHSAPNASSVQPFYVINRVVCEELEVWYFGDPTACQAAYPRLKRAHFSVTHLNDPATVKGDTWESFGHTLHKVGHLPATPPNHRWKHETAELIGQHLSLALEVNQSTSFQVFINGIHAFQA